MVAVLIVGMLMPSCAAESDEEAWSSFGPFDKPVALADHDELPGPSYIRVPEVGEVRLDAAELLPAEQIIHEAYTFTYDEQRPMIGGVVAVKAPAEGDEPERFVTSVIGVEVLDGEARLSTRTDVFSGAPHESWLAATSDLGVVAVMLEGELLPDQGPMTRIIGVDVARGTEVWFKEHGRPEFGVNRTFWIPDPAGDDQCPALVELINVASGTVRDTLEGVEAERHC